MNSISKTGTQPDISVIVPLYNVAPFAQHLVDMLVAQSFSNFEVFLVDDGSTDETVQLCKQAIGSDARFHLLSQENSGSGVARNKGLSHAQGSYVSFIDADDTIDKHYLEELFNSAQKHDADIAICQAKHYLVALGRTDPSIDRWPAEYLPEAFSPKDFADDLFGTFRSWLWDKLFKREFLLQNNIHFPALFRTQDLAFVCTALACAKTISLVNKELYTYRIGDSSSATNTRDRAPSDFFKSALVFRHNLVDRGLYDTFKTSYAQWIGLCCVVNVASLRTAEAYESVYTLLHETGLAQLDLRAPRLKANPFMRTTAAGDLTDKDVEKALKIIEKYPHAKGGKRLQRYMDKAMFRGEAGRLRKKHGVRVYPAGRG